MSIHVKTAAGWEELGVSGGGGASSWGRVNGKTPTGSFTVSDESFPSFAPVGSTWDYFAWGQDADGNLVPGEVGDHEVDLTGGLYWALAVGGGSGGYNNTDSLNRGQPGLVNEGLWEFGRGTHAIEVGKSGVSGDLGVQADMPRPSSIEDYGTQGLVAWGHQDTGRGAEDYSDLVGYKSRITGDELEYAPGNGGPQRPGRAGWQGRLQGEAGCVIIAVRTDVEAAPVPEPAPELPGLGVGWATITSVTGSPKRYAYNDGPGGVGGFDWVAFEWTDTTDPSPNSLTTQAGGLVDCFLISGGGGGTSTYFQGTGGRAAYGLQDLTTGTVDIKVGAGGPNDVNNGMSNPSQIATFPTGVNGFGKGGPGLDNATWREIESSITGESRTYGRFGDRDGKHPETARPNRGDGGYRGAWAASNGVVIVRVPAAQAAGVDPGSYNDVTVRSVAKEKVKEAVKSRKKTKK